MGTPGDGNRVESRKRPKPWVCRSSAMCCWRSPSAVGLSGLAGFLFLIRFGNITVTAAQGLELQVVAAVVVGGVNIFGGSGSMVGAALGVLLIEVLQQSLLRWASVSEFVKDAILGLLILLAVLADTVILGRLREMWAAARRRDQARSTSRRGDLAQGVNDGT